MTISANILKALVEDELTTVSDARVIEHVRRMLVEPYMLLRVWDYGYPGQLYPCWIVLEYNALPNGAIGYCEFGFGPLNPWGLISSSASGNRCNIGMDTGWHPTFLQAFFESFAAIELPIWRVFKIEPKRARTPLTDEGAWEFTWKRIEELRSSDPAGRYECDHDISYGSKK